MANIDYYPKAPIKSCADCIHKKRYYKNELECEIYGGVVQTCDDYAES